MAVSNWSRTFKSFKTDKTDKADLIIQGTWTKTSDKNSVYIEKMTVSVYSNGISWTGAYTLTGTLLVNNEQVYDSNGNSYVVNLYNNTESDIIVDKTVELSQDDSSFLVELSGHYGNVSSFNFLRFYNGVLKETIAFAETTSTVSSYLITYDANGGSGAPEQEFKTTDEDYIISSITPYKELEIQQNQKTFSIIGKANEGQFLDGGTEKELLATSIQTDEITYVFNNWNTLPDGSGETYEQNQIYSVNAEIKLYAQYSSVVNTTFEYTNNQIDKLESPFKVSTFPFTYIVEYNARGGILDVLKEEAPVTRKYTFKGWSESLDSYIEAAESYNTSVELYAFWEEEDINSKIILPFPERVGYSFQGWFYEEETNQTLFQPGEEIEVKSDITYYAFWKPEGLVRIYVDNEYKKALIYLYDGEKWQLTQPYINIENNWKIIS